MNDDTKELCARLDVNNKLLFKILEKQEEILREVKNNGKH